VVPINEPVNRANIVEDSIFPKILSLIPVVGIVISVIQQISIFQQIHQLTQEPENNLNVFRRIEVLAADYEKKIELGEISKVYFVLIMINSVFTFFINNLFINNNLLLASINIISITGAAVSFSSIPLMDEFINEMKKLGDRVNLLRPIG
jgi:hypothetical protein